MHTRNPLERLTKQDHVQSNDSQDINRPRRPSNNQQDPTLLYRASSEVPDIFGGIPSQSPFINRQESNANPFTGFHYEELNRPTPVRVNLTQTYAMECLEYEKYLFDNRIKLIIKKIAIHAYNIFRNEKESPFFVFPLQKLLTTIAKKLLLNRFELLFLEYVLEQTKFRYNIDCIFRHYTKFNSFILSSDSEMNNTDIKLMQIYILYCAYYSKKSLNQLPADNIFTDFFKEICPQFKERFPEWVQQSGVINKISPKIINKIFKKLTFNSDHTHEDVENYSLLVEEIIDISPAYNADKSGKKKKNSRKKKGQEQKLENPDSFPIEKQEDHNKFSEIIQQQSQFPFQSPLLRNKKKSSFISNIDALEVRHYLTRSMSNHQC